MLRFVETPVFTSQVTKAVSDSAYARFQRWLQANPDAGDVIQASGGLRKTRMGLPGRGRRGGARVIYYWYREDMVIYLLFLYPKSEQDDLTPDQLQTLRKVIEGDKDESGFV